MLAIFTLSLLIFTQTTLASSSDDDWLDSRDLSHLLDAEKRYADKYAASMRVKKTTRDTPDPEPQCSPADIGLIIDASRSIWGKHFRKGQRFLADFMDKFDVGLERDQDRVAAVSFADIVYKNDAFDFDDSKNGEEAKANLLRMRYWAGQGTETADALKYMRELQIRMGRSSARQLQLVLTDGQSNQAQETRTQAALTKEANITVVAVGVGDKNRVDPKELIDIAGGVAENAHLARSYDELDKELIGKILLRLCKPLAACGLKFPADINFVFSAATMGLTQTSIVTSFISNVIEDKKLEVGFQFGVVSGDCPDDEGFRLNQYNSPGAIREHLERYKGNNLPFIIQRATETRFTTESGARVNATKTAVIFLGKNKVNKKALVKAIKGMLASGVRVFVSVSYKKVPTNLKRLLPNVTFLLGNTVSQATQLVNHLCPNVK